MSNARIKNIEELKQRLIEEGDHIVFIPDFVKKYANTKAVKPLLSMIVELTRTHYNEFGVQRTSWFLIDKRKGENRRMPKIKGCYISHIMVYSGKGTEALQENINADIEQCKQEILRHIRNTRANKEVNHE